MVNLDGGASGRRIAYVVPMGAGLDTFIYREVESLYARGDRISLFATKFNPGDVFAPKKEWPCYTVSVAQLAFRSPLIAAKLLLRPGLLIEACIDGGIVDLIFAVVFAPVMRSQGVSQIHCHFGDHKLFIGYYCKRLLGLPLTVTIHAHEFYTNPNEKLFRKALTYCDRVFPIATRWQEKLVNEYDVPQDKIRLNRLFVDCEVYKPSSDIRVLSVGRFTERKGFEYLMDAARLLGDLEIHFMFVGFGELDLLAMARRKGIADRVTVFEKMDQGQLKAIYQMADILCVPSITTENEGAEGIPVVLIEGMACGLPVVATRCGAIQELVEEILVDEKSAEQLANALRSLAESSDLRVAQGQKNREIVNQHYSEKNVEQFGCWLAEVEKS